MNDPDNAPSPNRFCSRFGTRNAALNASAGTDRSPKKWEKVYVRTRPASRLTRMPAATIASAAGARRRAGIWLTATRRRLWPRDRPVGVRRLPGEPRHHDCVLLEVLLAHALVHIDVRVMHPHVVVLVFLDRVEPRHTDGAEAQVIGITDSSDDVSTDAKIGLCLERREPLVEKRLRGLARLTVPAVNRACRGIDVEVG